MPEVPASPELLLAGPSQLEAWRVYQRWGFEPREQFHLMSCYLTASAG